MSQLEEQLVLQIRAARLPSPEREYRFHPTRKWRADLAWPPDWLLVEVEGGTWTGGRHTRGAGFDRDAEKYAEAVLAGWRVLRVGSTAVKSGAALGWIERALGVGK